MPVPEPPPPSVPDVGFTVVRATAQRLDEAMAALLAAGPAAAARFVRQAHLAKVRLDNVWCLADAQGRYRLTAMAIVSTGRTAMVLNTHPRTSAEAQALGLAIAAALKTAKAEADLAQALIEPGRPLDLDAVEAGGLTRLAVLDYLECTLTAAHRAQPDALPLGWEIVPLAQREHLDASDASALTLAARATLIHALEASYRDTLDCPGLAGVRDTTDVVDGHYGLGARRRVWLTAREHDETHGVCLLNVSPDNRSAELVYLGVAPYARGGGIDRVVLDTGLRDCAAQGCISVALAVDERNTFAHRLYAARGFRSTSTRIALVRSLRNTSE